MAFPSNIQFVPIKVNGVPPSDPAGDVTPASVDIVGDAQFPPAYYAYDGQNVYFRIRLQGDPRSNNSFQNRIWGVLFDYQTPPSYEFMMAVDGGRSWITLVRNGNQSTSGDPLTDRPEGSDGNGFPNFQRPINNFDLARAGVTNDGSTFGGTSNYFLDFFIDTGTFFSQLTINGINFTPNSPVRMLFFTATTNQNFDKDSLPFSDSVTFNQANVRAQLTASAQNTLPAVIPTGRIENFKRKLQVSNVGTSPAQSISVTVTPGDYTIITAANSTPSIGNAAFDTTTNTLSWNIGNLANGQTASYSVDLTTVFPNPGQITLDTFVVRGIDQFTGNTLPDLQFSQQIAVQASGSISGVIKNIYSGLPVDGVSVALLPAGAFQTVSDTNGEFGITGIPPGSYTIQLSRTDFQTQLIPVTIAEGQSITLNPLFVPLPAAIHGTIVSSIDSSPIVNVRVAIEDPLGVFIAEAFTDNNGQYTIANLPAGKLRISAGAEGYRLVSFVITLLPAEDRVIDVVLVPNPSSVTGQVTSTNGQPISGAAINLLNEQRGLQFETLTDANGQFSLDLLVPGILYLVRVTAVGFAGANAFVRVAPGATETINLELTALPGSLSGTVREEGTNLLLANVAISIQELNGVLLDTFSTDNLGQFSIDSLAAGTYTLLLNSTTYSNREISVTISMGMNTSIEVFLTRLSGSLRGSVTDEGGRPLIDALITILLNNKPIIRDFTDESGSYFIANLTTDIYVVVAESAGFAAKQLGALIQPLQATQLDFVLQADNGSVFGTVMDLLGNPLQGAVVRAALSVIGLETVITQSVSDTTGAFIISGLTPGEYILTAALQRFQNVVTIVVVQPGQQTQTAFQLIPNPGRITGRVTSSTGEVIAASVSIIITNSTETIVSTIFTELSGSYVTNDLAPGFYLLTFQANGFQTNQLTVEVITDSSVNGDLILFPLPGSVQGRVLDNVTLAPIEGAFVKVSTQHGLTVNASLTDNTGLYKLSGLQPGNYSILATADDYDFLVVGATVVADTITETNFALSQLTGNIEGILDPPIPDVLVRLSLNNNLSLTSTLTDNTGTFRFIELRAGNYILAASANNYSSSPVGVMVAINQTAQTVIQLNPNPGSISGIITADTGEPISNAAVLIFDQTETLRGNGQTSQWGSYFIGTLPSGLLSIIISAAGFADQSGAVRLSPGEQQTGINYSLLSLAGGISGQISDADTGELLISASIEIRSADASGIIIAIATTSQFGNFIVDDLRPSSYTVIVSADGYATNSVGAIVQNNMITGASLQLTRLKGSIEGRIRSSNNIPLINNGTSIKLFTANGTLVNTLFANNDGLFFIEGILPDTYQLSVTSPGFTTNSQTINVIANMSNLITITLSPEVVALSGTVHNAVTKEPLEGVLIGINGRTAIPIETVYTDRSGGFIINFLPLGRFTIFASLIGFSTNAVAINAISTVTQNIPIELSPNPGTVVGFVTNLQDGSLIAGAEIKLFNRSQLQLATILTDNTGSYEYNQLFFGNYFLFASANGFATSQSGFQIEPGTTSKLSFALQPLPGTVTGTIKHALTGDPIVNVIIVLRPFNNFAAPLALTATDSSGHYLIQDLPEGNYTMNVTLFGFQLEQSSFFVGKGGVIRVDFVLRPSGAGVIGKVTDTNTGAGVPESLVVGIDDNGVIIGQGVTDQEGFYALGTGTEGPITVVAILGFYEYGLVRTILSPGKQTSVNLQLKPGAAQLRGITFNADSGAPISGVVITVLTEQLIAIESISSDEEGNFIFLTLSPGSYVVTATSPIYASQAQRVTVSGNSESDPVITFRMPTEYGTLTGTIRDTEGRPLYKALVEIYIPDPILVQPASRSRKRVNTKALEQAPAVNGTFVRSTISDVNGRYTLTNLPAGTLLAVFTYPDKKPALRNPIIMANQTTVLDVVLEDEDEE